VIAHRAFAFGPLQARRRQHHVEASVEDVSAHAEALERERLHPARRIDGLWATLRRISTPAPWKSPADRPPLRRRAQLLALRLFGRGRFFPEISQHVEHGDMLRLGGGEWFVLHTPGHTADHICLHDPDGGVFLTGDHVLPTITPHIGGLSEGRDPLKSFFYSLDRVGEISGVKLALPAHGHPFYDLRARAEAIKQHHRERLGALKQIAAALGPASVEQFMQQLFQPRSWGDMAESETYAHLEHLRLGGNAQAHRGPDGRLIYEL
jgi:glyoxylase-like metal-dependent hydrolase (beta-lactamase superfamily II)